MMPKFDVKYTATRNVTIVADSEPEAQEKAWVKAGNLGAWEVVDVAVAMQPDLHRDT